MTATTCTNTQTKPLMLEDIQKAMKAITNLGDVIQKEKEIGIKAIYLKFYHPEFYKKLGDEEKFIINNTIERAAYIHRKEIEDLKWFTYILYLILSLHLL